MLLVDRMSPGDKVRNKAALEDLVEEYRERRERYSSTNSPGAAKSR